jgi:hypothetical protein
MKQRTKLLGLTAAAGMVCAVGFALVSIESRGTWPRSWPKELDPLRDRARIVGVANGIRETVYEIPFGNQLDFEQAWPLYASRFTFHVHLSHWRNVFIPARFPGNIRLAFGVPESWL